MAKKFRSFAEAEKADRDFYKKLTGKERLRILVELLNHAPEHLLTSISGASAATKHLPAKFPQNSMEFLLLF
jgi:hypothetical protein